MKWMCLLGVGGALFALSAPAGQPGFHAQFVGGTVTGIPAKSSTRLDLGSPEALVL